MPYLIDGHNLIGRMPGMSLQDPDDEAALLVRLRAFCSREATTATVYFDGAVLSTMKDPPRGGVTARYVARPQSADSAIRHRLERIGREAPNWVVVTSDVAVAEAARRCRARVMSSEAFARRLTGVGPPSAAAEKPDGPSDRQRLPLALPSRRRPAAATPCDL
jgi:predicted RNA-binding protein with PIN domain